MTSSTDQAELPSQNTSALLVSSLILIEDILRDLMLLLYIIVCYLYN
jgi:hypothetical protein